MVRMGLAIKAALGVLLTCTRAPAEDRVRIQVGEKGLLSLRYKGVEYCDPSGAGEVGFTGTGTRLAAAKPEDATRFVSTPTTVSLAKDTVTQTYPWGTLMVAYEAQGADLNVTATLRNTSGAGLSAWRANLLQLNDRIVFRCGGGTFGFSPEMQWSYYYEQTAGAQVPYDHYTQSHPHVYWWVDRASPFQEVPVKVFFADLTGTWDTGVGRLKTDVGDRWPVFAAATVWEMAPPDQIQENIVTVAVRFRDKTPDDRAIIERNQLRIRNIEKQVADTQAKLKAAEEDRGLELCEQSVVDAARQALAAQKDELEKARVAAQTEGMGGLPSALDVCADGYEAWGRYNYREAFWSDRRPIGAFFGCPDGRGSQTNPNGWFKDAAVDTTTPEGRAAFAKRLLAHIDATIAVLKRADAQGMLWWDLEGQRQPHPITYIGDPRVLDPAHPHHRAFAPELDTPVEYQGRTMPVVDACFRKLKDAGFKTGMTIRPQQLAYTTPIPVEQARLNVQTAEKRVAEAKAKLAAPRGRAEASPDDHRGVDAAEKAPAARGGLDGDIEDRREVAATEKQLDVRGRLEADIDDHRRGLDTAGKELQAQQAELARAEAELRIAELGPYPTGQVYPPHGDQEILSKARYAHDRWGCTLFYVDSLSAVFGYWAIDKAARELQDCLFLPEWAVSRTYRCSAQFSYTPMTGYTRGVPEEIQAAWPDAFCAMGNLRYGDPGVLSDLLIAVRRGNLPVFDCFYDNAGAVNAIREVYTKAGTRHAPRARDQQVTTPQEQAVAITLAAEDEDGEALIFHILSQPSRGTLAGFDAKAGTGTYTPAKGQTGLDAFTFKATDASGLNSNRGKVTVMVNGVSPSKGAHHGEP